MARDPDAVPVIVRLAADEVRWRLLRRLSASDLRVRELCEQVGQPQNLVSYHLRELRAAGLVAARRSSHDAREVYYRLDLDVAGALLADAGRALQPSLGPRPAAAPAGRARVLFLCTGNSARSPIAAALLARRTRRVTASSAGSRPKQAMHAEARRVLREDYAIDLRARRPRHWDEVDREAIDLVISLCDRAREDWRQATGHYPAIHWSVPDPAVGDGGRSAFRAIAADIDRRITGLLPALSTATDPEKGPEG